MDTLTLFTLVGPVALSDAHKRAYAAVPKRPPNGDSGLTPVAQSAKPRGVVVPAGWDERDAVI